MKHVFSVLSVTCVAFFTIFLSTTNVSCKKGDTGPKGDTGVANMIYSAWQDVSYTRQVPSPGDTIYVAAIPAPKMTKDVLDKDEIKVYINFGTAADPDIAPIPYFDGGVIINPDFEVGSINLVSNVNAGTQTSAGNKYFQYRYILITGSVPARRDASFWNNYAEVQRAFNIPD
jgi:hypothetical protein